MRVDAAETATAGSSREDALISRASDEFSDIVSFRFTANDLKRRKGIAHWREFIGRAVLNLDLKLIPDHPFHCEARGWHLPGVRLSIQAQSGVHTARGGTLLADGNDDCGLLIGGTSSAIVSHRGEEAPLGSGNALLVSNAEPCSIAWPSLSRVMAVQLPRGLLAPLVPELDDRLMLPIRRENEALKLLTGYIKAVTVSQLPSTHNLRHLVAMHLRDLIAAALGASRDGAAIAEEGGIRAARLHAIKAEIAASLDRDELSVGWVAGRQGITPRYVQMLFEGEGATFSEFVRAQRLARALSLLADPRRLRHSITEIAFDVGFGSLSYFNRAFRRRYGMTPSDMRALAMRRKSGDVSVSLDL